MKKEKINIKFTDMFWLFIIASYVGLIMEGFYCLIKFGKWESHVVSIYGHFCVLYGFGVVFYYVFSKLYKDQKLWLRYIVYCSVGTFVELIAGLLLEFGLGMYAWSYKNSFLNFRVHICLFMFLIWGIIGLAFEKCDPYIDKMLKITHNKFCKIITPFFVSFMVVNLTFTGICIYRWSERHVGEKPSNKLEKYIDKKYPDKYMKNRFMEWFFYDED